MQFRSCITTLPVIEENGVRKEKQFPVPAAPLLSIPLTQQVYKAHGCKEYNVVVVEELIREL